MKVSEYCINGWVKGMSKLKRIRGFFINLIRSPILLLLLLEGVVVVLLYNYGFRITYGPELVSSWEAVSAIGQWAGVLVGFLIPIAAVYLQSKLDESKKDIGESNTALLDEFEKFEDEYEGRLRSLKSHLDRKGNFVIDGGNFSDTEETEQTLENLKRKAHKFVNTK
ncbi:MAG TPA: hypothetical protein DCG38_04025 [Eubacteriaceae bacterium]|nr:hypothetical protein [Eubacteriaceae bacterium]